MTLLPIVERELRERARWRSTYWVRGVAAFLATAVAGFVLMFLTAASSGSIGHAVMETLAWLAFPFVVLEGLRNTADALSEEKREGTLGLLFLTDLRGYDVVLGKFFASSLTSFYVLLAMLPALAIPVLLGGVTGAEFWRLVLSLINALFFSLTTGMFVSAISRHERKAWVGTFALIGFFFIAVPIIGRTFNWPWLAAVSPTTAFWFYDAKGYPAATKDYWRAIWVPHAISWLWLGLASFLLPRVWQESGERRTHRPVAHGTRPQRRRSAQLAANPIWWLTARHTEQRKWLWVFIIFISAVGVLCWMEFQRRPAALWTIFGIAILIHLGLSVWVAFEACNSFAEARSTGAMELLLSTPLHVRQILRGQHLALRELFLAPLALLLLVEVCLAAAHISLLSQNSSGARTFEAIILILMLGFSIVWFVLDLFAVAEVGMWYGLTSAKPTQALTKTVLFVLVLPLLVSPCCLFVTPGLMVAKSVIFFTWAQSKLENEFRRAATERYDSRGRKWLIRAPKKLRMPGEI
jgi:hypothetical protein